MILKIVTYNGSTHRNFDTSSEGHGLPQEIILQAMTDQIKESRKSEYEKFADPLYMNWQKELAKGNPNADSYKQKWLDKAEEIESKHPLPI